MAKKVTGYIKLQIPAGKATPAPPVGPALGQHGVNIVQFTKEFNARTADQGDMIIPVVITVYADRSFSFITKTPPAAVLINMIMNDDTWYVVRNTRGVTGFVGPGSKPVPLTDEEMVNLGITGGEEKVELDLEVGDAVVVTGGAWKDTTGLIQSINDTKQMVTINVELFGRETPVEISFAEVKKM